LSINVNSPVSIFQIFIFPSARPAAKNKFFVKSYRRLTTDALEVRRRSNSRRALGFKNKLSSNKFDFFVELHCNFF
jgi:hypothetical protein